MLINSNDWQALVYYFNTKNNDYTILKNIVNNYKLYLTFKKPPDKSIKILISLLKTNQISKIKYWISQVDIEQELWLLLLEVGNKIKIPNTIWYKAWNIFQYHFILKLADNIRNIYKKRIRYSSSVESSEEDLYLQLYKLTYWERYLINMKMAYSIAEISKLTKLTYKQLYIEDNKLWIKLQKIS